MLRRNIRFYLRRRLSLMFFSWVGITHHHVDFRMPEHRSKRYQIDARLCCPSSPGKYKGPPLAKLVRALVQLMRWSGLAITDALTLPTARFTNAGGKYRVVTQRTKTGTDVSIVLPPQVGREILSVAVGDYLFWDGAGDIVKSWTKYVMPPLFEAAQIERGGNMMSHRLRDTFACDLLSKGVPIQEVSKLLGHTSVKTTEKSYAKWVQGRQDRLDALVTATWDV